MTSFSVSEGIYRRYHSTHHIVCDFKEMENEDELNDLMEVFDFFDFDGEPPEHTHEVLAAHRATRQAAPATAPAISLKEKNSAPANQYPHLTPQ